MIMKNLSVSFLSLLLLASIVSCDKPIFENDNSGNGCVFEQVDEDMDGLIDDNERAIMDDCKSNALTSISEIEQNLIGEWELVGHGEGWVPRVSQPCAYLTITSESLSLDFNNGSTDTLTTHTWEVKQGDSGDLTFFLKASESNFALFINQFCEEYMYGDATPVDGNMHLYQKVK